MAPTFHGFARVTALAAGLVLLAAGACEAGRLASAALRSENAERLECYISNVGDSPVTFTSVTIRDDWLLSLELSFNSCDTLNAGSTCFFSADAGPASIAGAVVYFADSAKGEALRGHCQLMSASDTVLATTDLR
jgi:hypothetical protein